MTWLVTWLVIMNFSVPCEPITIHDPYRGTITMPNTYLVDCRRTEYTPMSAYFISYEEAKKFVDNANESVCKDGQWESFDCDLKDFEIKEVR